MIKLGHSSISEKGTINGKPGDSTGGEVCVRSWYEKGWTYIYRPLSIKLAESLVKAMNNACANDNIGYGQSDRLTLYYECLRLAKKGRIMPKHIKQVTNKVNCDCSSLVALCCIASGLKVSPAFTTWSMYGELKATKCFEIITYVRGKTSVEYGDIIQSSGHTAIVVQSDRTIDAGGKVTAKYPAYSYDSAKAGMYTVRVSDFLALRDGADTDKNILCKLDNGAIVYCYGYYTKDWLYVQYTHDNVIYTGFCHQDYLHRV